MRLFTALSYSFSLLHVKTTVSQLLNNLTCYRTRGATETMLFQHSRNNESDCNKAYEKAPYKLFYESFNFKVDSEHLSLLRYPLGFGQLYIL